MTNNGTLSYRVGQLEKKVEKLDNKLDKIMTNHLPHVETELIAIKTRVNVLTAVNIGAIVLLAIINRFL